MTRAGTTGWNVAPGTSEWLEALSAVVGRDEAEDAEPADRAVADVGVRPARATARATAAATANERRRPDDDGMASPVRWPRLLATASAHE
jgi:hypothetical protein